MSLRAANGAWITGSVGPFTVQALAFDEPSQYGMPEDERISKLWVRGAGGQVVYDYDRGDEMTNRLFAEVLAEIVAEVGRALAERVPT